MRWAKALREFRLAGVLRASYTYSFHASGCASVAQWQSTGFVNLRLWVRLPPLASQARKAVDSIKAHRPGDRSRQRPFLARVGHCPEVSRREHGWADGRAANGIRL